MLRRGAFPGSLDPLTIAHLEVARLARERHRLDEVHLIVSRVALDKPAPPGPPLKERIEMIAADASAHAWLSVHMTDEQLIVDIAFGYEVVIMGADKWVQINEPHWYGSPAARDAAIAALPEVAVAARPPHEVPAVLALDTDESHHDVSSSRARAGDTTVMLEAAQRFAERSGAWIDPSRYDRWIAAQG